MSASRSRDPGITRPQGSECHLLDPDAIADTLAVDLVRGLTDVQATARLEQFGPNQLREQPPRPGWKVFADQLRSGLFLILLVAAGLAALVGDATDAAIIGAVVLINATIGFVEERKATRSLAALKGLLVPTATIRRDDRLVTLPSADLVPGDVVMLDAGSRVPADGRLLVAHDTAVDQSSLTGESVPVAKHAETMTGEVALADRANMLHAGTVVVRGRAELLVTATGMATEVGQIAGMLLSSSTPRTPLQRQLDVAGRRIAVIGIVAVVLYSAAAALRGDELADIALRGVALAVAAVPEGLPAVLALVLAVGVHRMADHGAIVRRLASVETLGSATVICTDKTGTLTRNRMTVRQLVPAACALGQPVDDPRDPRRLLSAFVLCNDAAGTEARAVGDPMEVALVAAASSHGVDVMTTRHRTPRVAELPFSAEAKFMATAHRSADGTIALAVKGAPDVLLPRCGHALVNGATIALDDELRAKLLDAVDARAAAGLRVLAAADAHAVSGPQEWTAQTLARSVDDLVFLGFAGIADPPRPEAVEAVALCRRAGIAVKMVTGDHVATAAAIAGEVGIAGRAVTGAQLDAMDRGELDAVVDDIGVFARVTPAHKVAIVAALTANGHVAAMTGDGQNDAAAVRAADVGVAMGRTGTDVTKEAADLVLTDDNFATIVRAVRQGRGIYDNIVKFIRFQLTTNIAAILTFVAAVLAGLPAPMTAVQVLWVNLITDGPPALALGLDGPSQGIMDRPPRPPGEKILSGPRLTRMALVATVMAAGTLSALASVDESRGIPYAVTFAFTTFVLFQVANAFNVRSELESAFSRAVPHNRALIGSLLLVVGLQVLVVHVPFMQGLFGTVALDPLHWAAAAAVASLALLTGEIDKAVRRRGATTPDVGNTRPW
ncbi:calcium-translocating P-type ATPase, PMCA-type [Mycobacterium cookii]|uniref:Calcium-translocating P-type ATPase, PMCA-type n=1 Tax=Nocardioides furvisabuli TaxID=375542 RepID=A0ABN2XGE4_9ACTN|nr:HAD-IC family P-type ATPase [Nocardioides furvisabuli]